MSLNPFEAYGEPEIAEGETELALRSTRATALESEQLLAAEPAQPLPLLLFLRRAHAYYVNMLGNLESMRPRSVICIGALRKVSLRVCT
jgi:hypothetical protein